MIPRSTTGPIDELAAVLTDLRARVQTVELLAHRHRFDLDPTAWAAPVLLNGWVNIGGAFQVAQYRRVGDMVELRGVIAAGVIGLACFQLPVGFRPPANVNFACESAAAHGAFAVTALGNVVTTAGNNAAFSLQASFSVTP
jgi:hypothetical protein